MHETDLAWAAGLVDGEGSIHVSMNRKGGIRLSFTVVNTNKEMLDHFQVVMGGNVYRRHDSDQKNKERWAWMAVNKFAIECLEKIAPFIVGKRRQVEIALEFKETLTQRGVPTTIEQKDLRQALYGRMRVLNARGPLQEVI